MHGHRQATVEGLAEVVLDGETILRQDVSLAPDSSQPVARVARVLNDAPRVLSTRLTASTGEILAANDYDLAYHQQPGLPVKDYLFSRLAELTVRW